MKEFKKIFEEQKDKDKKKKKEGKEKGLHPDYSGKGGEAEGVMESTALIKSFAEKSGKSEAEVEKLWEKMKEEYGEDYKAIVGSLKKALNINEKLDEAWVGDIEEFKNFIVFLFGSVAQFHIYHLLTRNGTHHEALGALYKGLDDELDSICEQVLAGQRFEGGEDDEYGNEISFYYDHEDCVEDIKELSSYASDMIRTLDGVENLALVNELTEIKELCDKTLYKMNLS